MNNADGCRIGEWMIRKLHIGGDSRASSLLQGGGGTRAGLGGDAREVLALLLPPFRLADSDAAEVSQVFVLLGAVFPEGNLSFSRSPLRSRAS